MEAVRAMGTTYQANGNRYETMKYRRCGDSGLMLPLISLGLWHNFGEIENREIEKILGK